MNRITAKQEGVKREKGDRGYKERQCRLFLKAISNLGNDDRASAGDMPGERFVDKEVFLSLVDKVVVGEGLRFVLRDGTEWKHGAGDEPALIIRFFGCWSMAVWRRQGISGKANIAVLVHAGWAGGVPPAAFVEKVVVSGMNKDVQLVYLLRDGSEHKADCYFFKSSAKPRQTNCFRNLLN